MSAAPSQSRRRWSLRGWLGVVGAVTTAVMATAILAGALVLTQLTQARETLVDQLDPALLAAETLTTALIDEETSVRGFAVTGRPDFLDPYRQARQQEGAVLATLRRLGATEPRPELTGQLDETITRAQRWRADYAEPTIAAVSAKGATGALLDPVVGKARFDAVRVALDTQLAGLATARASARAALDTAADRLLAAGVLITVGLLGLLAAIGLGTHRMLTAPVAKLAAQVRQVAAGQFERPVLGQGPREVVELGADIDGMRRRVVGELTKVNELNGRLDGQAAELARSNSDLEQFAYVASHDLQEPLRKVSGFCELLANRYAGQLDERADQYIGFAVDGAGRMSVLISDLLAFSQVGRAAEAMATPLDTDTLVTQAIRNLGDLPAQTGARITRDTLPTVVGEASLLTTVFQNVIGNAIKFRGEQPPRIHIGVHRDGDHWSFRVADNGIGVDPAYAEKIFLLFQRLHTKQAYPGTGIGLALCRKIIEHHHGRIWLDPATTNGAVLCFTLPVIVEPER